MAKLLILLGLIVVVVFSLCVSLLFYTFQGIDATQIEMPSY